VTDSMQFKDVDVDGAIRETAEAASESLGDTRRGLLMKTAVAGGGVIAGGSILGAIVAGEASAAGKGRPPASFGKGDIGILNYALTLEYLEAAYYNEALKNQHKKTFIKDKQTQAFLKTVVRDENAHVKALKKVLGNKAAPKPKFDFGNATKSEKAFVTASFTFENEGVHAYSGQAFNIKSPAVLAAALSIVTIEARHASVIGLIKGAKPANIAPSGSFDTPFTAQKVLKDVTSLGYIVS